MKKISNKLKMILFCLVVAVMTLVGLNLPTKAADESGKITVTKSATKIYEKINKDNLQKGRYVEISLNVRANGYRFETEEISKLDIVLILDSSGSMYGERSAALKAAAIDFANEMLDGSGDVRIAAVEFANDVLSTQNFTSDNAEFVNYVKNVVEVPDPKVLIHGTNMQSAIEEATEILKETRNDAKKVVILLTDGVPTYFNYNGVRKGNGRNADYNKDICMVYKGSVCTLALSPLTAATNELNNLKDSNKDADVYTIVFGDEPVAFSALEIINPESSKNSNILYKNFSALTGEELKLKFMEIIELAKTVVATDGKVVDVIPTEFELTEESRKELINQGVKIEEKDGKTTLTWPIATLVANTDYNLTYEVIAREPYYGTIYTNERATLTATVEEDNPYYEETSVILEFDKPKVEIPAITTDDIYGDIGYSEELIIINESMIKNDTISSEKNAVYNVINNRIVIVEDENITRIGSTNQYKIEDKGTLTVNDDGTFSFVSLEGVSGDVEFNYYISTYTEDYEGKETTVTYSNTSKVIFSIHERELIEIKGTKTWLDNDNQDGKRPKSINIHLYKNGEYVASKVVTENGNWSYTFANLYKYEIGAEGINEIVYTITEDEVAEYTTTIDGYNVINTHEIEKIEISGTKTWDDNNDQDGKRPESITINLLADGKEVQEAIVTAEDNWKYTFSNLDKYANGQEIVYTITEDEVAEYTTTIDGYNVINTHEIEKIEISGTKTWDDNNNQDGIRPTSITINLLADGEVIASLPVTSLTNWKYSFKDLDKYKSGREIVYTIEEEKVEGYTTEIDGYNVTNKHEVEKVSVSGTKTWDDNNNQDGIRPTSITINLLADCKVIETKEVTEKENWSYEFKDLDKYESGNEIVYTIEEEKVEGYTTTINGYNVTNKHEAEKVSISGTKTWDDNNNQDGKRPNEITVILLADGNEIDTKIVTSETEWKYTFENLPKYRDGGIEVKYTVEEEMVDGYTSSVNGYNITNTYTPETITVKGKKIWNDKNNQDGKRPLNISINLYADGEYTGKVVTIDASDNWKYEFTNLPKYADGKEIVYTIEEDKVAGYTTVINGFDITNSYTTETTKVTVTKTWNDNNDQDGMRPESITINLLANNKIVKSAKVTEKDNWSYTFENLDKYANGELVTYTVEEEAVEGYKAVVDGYNITNTHTPITLSINGEKVWVDNNDEAGFRPESITVNLLANGEVIDTKLVTSEAEWKYTFENLPMYKDGQKIKYEVEELTVDNYETSYDNENPFIIVNTHNPSKITVSGIKTWVDNNDQDGIRPDSITINLTGKIGDEIVYEDSKVVSADDNWKFEFTNLPEYKYGKLISYTIDEEDVEGYSKEINGYDVINTHTPETIIINGSKVWDDNNNQDGIRPDKITVNLLADDKIIDTKDVSINEEGNWIFEFKNLPKYRDGGIEVKYSITEESVDGYESEITDFEITNIHTPETVSYNVSKVWSDYENNDGIRPNSITVRLIADGKEILSQVINEENNWSYSFENLPKYRNEGTLIVYEIVEDEVLGYTTTIESSVDVNNPNNTIVIVTNSHEKEQNSITISKIWEDYNNKYGKRPESITIHLYADGELVETLTITEETDWTAILSKDKYKNGVEIYYTIDEEEVAEYLTTIDGYTVTNKYIVPPHTGIEVDDNQTLYGTVVALIFSLLGSLFLLKNKLSK